MLEAHTQAFLPSPFFREVEPSPIEALTFHLTIAILSLGVNLDSLQNKAFQTLWVYLNTCANAASAITQALGSDAGSSSELEEAMQVATLTLSLLGFLDAAATFANFWTAPERLDLINRVKEILSEDFLVAVETAFSTIRNSQSAQANVKEWKRYVRHYAAIGRPVGAMLLQRSFMWLLVASSSLLHADIDVLRGNDILELLITGTRASGATTDYTLIETMAELATDEMSLLEDGADYLRLGSSWQQRIAFSVKAGALTSYLNCAMLNEDAADPDVLIAWLEDILADPVQMADETLARVVLYSFALVSKLSPSFAPNVSRLLPRFIVKSGARGTTIAIASKCLAYVLKNLSQDTIITTLYTLGNVLSSSSSPEKALNGGASGDFGLDGNTNPMFYSGKQSTGSSISLALTGEEETSVVYGNVVQAICGIAVSCNDAKITALAQSMLIQKIDKVSRSVDGRIITEAAALALSGGPLEFRSLLKLYAKISHDGVIQRTDILLGAVSHKYF